MPSVRATTAAGLVIGLQPLEFAFAVHRRTRFVVCNPEMFS